MSSTTRWQEQISVPIAFSALRVLSMLIRVDGGCSLVQLV